MKQFVTRFLREEEGVTMIEYGLIAALIALVCVAAISAIGGSLATKFQKIADCVADPKACV